MWQVGLFNEIITAIPFRLTPCGTSVSFNCNDEYIVRCVVVLSYKENNYLQVIK